MNQNGGWMGDGTGEGMWLLMAIGVLVVVLLAFVIGKLSNK